MVRLRRRSLLICARAWGILLWGSSRLRLSRNIGRGGLLPGWRRRRSTGSMLACGRCSMSCEDWGEWEGVNPLSAVRQFKESERELSFLSLEQIGILLKALESAGDAYLVAKVCLATGARWSEAETLRPSQVRGGMLNFSGTKSGKNRLVPISEALEAELWAHLRGRVWGGGRGDGEPVLHGVHGKVPVSGLQVGACVTKRAAYARTEAYLREPFMMNGGISWCCRGSSGIRL